MKKQTILFLILLCLGSFSPLFGQWTGTWSSTYGELRLIQNGTKVSGDYATQGVIEGTYNAAKRTLTGSFYNKKLKRTGFFRFTLNGKSFSGTWGWNRDMNTKWTGTRIRSTKPSLKSSEFRACQGRWDSSFGELRFKQDGGKVYGDYARIGTIEGTFNPVTKVLKGYFTNKGLNRSGQFEFTMSNNSFSGKWGWSSALANGKWTGKKVSSSIPTLTSPEYKSKVFDPVIRPSRVKTANIRLPFSKNHQSVKYTVDSKGNMVIDDMILGKEKDVLARHGNGKVNNWYRGSVPNSKSHLNRPGKKGTYQVRTQGLTSVSDYDLLWPFGLIPYTFSSTLTSANRTKVREVMDELEKVTSLRFVRRKSSKHKDYIQFVRDDSVGGCGNSSVGRQGNRQVINLKGSCFSFRTIAHEIFHAVGVWHEQSRPDRDKYVKVIRTNIKDREDFEHNFDKHTTKAIGQTDYDFKSIMHYSKKAFAKKDKITLDCANGVSGCPTSFGGSKLTTLDIQGINKLYPISLEYQGGHTWGGGAGTTDIAFGDIDGDGKDEVCVTRSSPTNARFFVFDDAENDYKQMFSDGQSWGSGYWAVSAAFGDMDGDGKDELAIARNAKENGRVMVYRFERQSIRSIGVLGKTWGSGGVANKVAFGDIDGDGKEELAISRKTPVNARIFLFNWNATNRSFTQKASMGSNWAKDDYATAVAFGDYDKDGKDDLAIGRKVSASNRFRYGVYKWNGSRLATIFTDGNSWGTGGYVTDLAFGDVTGDGKKELGITRYTQTNARVFIVGRRSGKNQTIKSFGSDWGSSNYATSIAFGDTDGDGKEEIFFSRYSSVNGRMFLYDDRTDGYDLLFSNGQAWFSSYGSYNRTIYGTAVNMGDTNGDGILEKAVGLSKANQGNPRWHIFK
ncbi:MAG: M12 family metallopeptidase [Bacteroidota bacterium]